MCICLLCETWSSPRVLWEFRIPRSDAPNIMREQRGEMWSVNHTLEPWWLFYQVNANSQNTQLRERDENTSDETDIQWHLMGCSPGAPAASLLLDLYFIDYKTQRPCFHFWHIYVFNDEICRCFCCVCRKKPKNKTNCDLKGITSWVDVYKSVSK